MMLIFVCLPEHSYSNNQNKKREFDDATTEIQQNEDANIAVPKNVRMVIHARLNQITNIFNRHSHPIHQWIALIPNAKHLQHTITYAQNTWAGTSKQILFSCAQTGDVMHHKHAYTQSQSLTNAHINTHHTISILSAAVRFQFFDWQTDIRRTSR